MAGRKKADPLAELAEGVAADHALAKAKGEVADTVAAGAIEGAGAVMEAGGDANQTAAGAIGGAAAASAEVQAEASAPVDTTTTEAPPEADDEAEESDVVFDRRLDRLSRIVEEAEFESGTAVGDIRDCLRELFKTRDKPWHLLDANQRKDLDAHFTKIGQMFVRKIVQVVAEEDFETLQGTMLENFNVKGDALEVKLKLSHVDPEVLLAAYKLAGKSVVVINASDHKFGGARRPNDPGEQQTEIPFSDPPAVIEKSAAPEHPDDDSDLAGGGNPQDIRKPSFGDGTIGDLQGVEKHDPDAADWIVYDADGQVWLAEASEDDPWTDEPEKAMRFTLQEAKDECETHGEGMTVQRHPDADKTEGDAAE